MIKTSDAYLMAINADSEQTMFSAEFGFIPPGSREGMILSSSGFGQLWGSRLSQLNNRVLGMGALWNTLELNRSVLGGGGEYIDPADTRQTGDWSTSQSGEDGKFAVSPYIEMTLDQVYDLIGIQIVFDNVGAEWATEIKVGYYDSDYSMMIEKIFTNNNANMDIDFSYSDVKRIRITINEWNFPRRFAKVCQVIPGQIRYFNDDNVFSFTLKEKISPFGALTIPEYIITFSNENQAYNIINPEGLISRLRERMEIPSNIGIVTEAGIEYISTGNFPLFSWPDSANDESTAFICRPDLAFANSNYILSGANQQTVLQVSNRISELANLSIPVAVDTELQNILVFAAIGENTILSDALGQLAIAAGGYVKFERNGSYRIKSITSGVPLRTIGYNSLWEKPTITQVIQTGSITINYGAWNSQGTKEIIQIGNGFGQNIEIHSRFSLNAAEARRTGNIAVDFFSNRLNYSFSYRGDMSIEAGDIVAVETDYGFRNILVLEHEISYNINDFLQGEISGVEI